MHSADSPLGDRSVPSSTYRLQIHAGFGYDDAAAIVPYLASLGISHLYLSPVLAAVPGSAHGYDVVDHDVIHPEAGGREGLERLAAAAHEHGLGIVVDVVPNHMAVPTPAHLNAPLWSVLRDGRASAFAHWFDVDWVAEDGTLLFPVLGSDLGDAIEAGEITVADDGGRGGDEAVLRYWDHEFPIAPGTESLPLGELVDAQHYRLTHWREGQHRLNYRRFFDVTGLIAIRVEEAEVFDATHRLLLELHRDGVIDGFRIDHPDGLADPAGYVRRLAEVTGGAWVVVEKILEGEETLPSDWPCAGTTGYDTLLRVQQLFVDPAGEAPLTRIWQEQSRDLTTLDELIVEAKAQVVHEVLPAEINRLVRDIDRILPGHDAHEVRLALGELLVSMDRYRAYLVPGEPADPASVEIVRAAAKRARDLLARGDYPALRTVVDLVTGTALPAEVAATDADVADVIVRFQQTSGPVMAKGIEDTAFYRYARLTGLNEVGGHPGHLGIDPEDVHDFATRMLETTPSTMTAGSTHDTKRSEDVRARLSTISERAEEWAEWLTRARELAAPHRRRGVDGATEYLIWQTLVGAWPIDEERMTGYVEKAVRESKARTTWTDPDETYESAIGRLVAGILAEPAVARHIEDWLEADAVAARANTLGQKAVQLLLPGVPDIYQGTERVDLSLVDPDNRRPVDYTMAAARLEALDAGAASVDLSDEKQVVTAAALRLRRGHAEWFTGPDANYAVVPSSSEHAFAFGRGDATGLGVVVIATRLAARLQRDGGWTDHAVTLPEGQWRDVLTDRAVRADAQGSALLADVLRDLPVAVLVRGDE